MNRPILKSAAFVVGVAVLVGSAAGLSFVVKALGAHLTKLPIQPAGEEKQHKLPGEFKGWPEEGRGWKQIGVDRQMSPEEIEELGTADTISRLYVEFGAGISGPNSEGRRPRGIQVHTAYYTGMIDTVPHVPDRCITAAGTAMDGSPREVPVPIDMNLLSPDPSADHSNGTIYRVRNWRVGRFVRLPRGIENLRMTVTPFKDGKSGQRFYAGYFFIANGGVVASANGVRLLAFRLQDDYAYYLKVQFTSTDAESEEGLGVLAGELLNNMLPELALRVPDWVEVQAGRYPPK
ncbi:MAG: hypothetical protein ACKVZJ_04885 [Phycisphaerales bacterium]